MCDQEDNVLTFPALLKAEYGRGPCYVCGADCQTADGRGICGACYEAKQDAARREEWLKELRPLQTVGALPAGCEKYDVVGMDPGLNVGIMVRLAQEWHMVRNAYFHGPAGSGKTAWAFGYVMRRSFDGMVGAAALTMPTLLRELRNFSPPERLQVARRQPWLLLTHVDAVVWTGPMLTQLWELLHERSEAGRRTVLTSRHSPKEWLKRMQVAVPDQQELAEAVLGKLNPCGKFALKGAE